MALPDGGHIPLREGNGLLYLDCTPVHDSHKIFAGFPASSPITKGAVTLPSPPSVPSVATDKGDFGRVLGHQPPLDVRTPPEISGFSASSASKFAENLVEFQTTPGPFPQSSMTYGAPTATFPIPIDGDLPRTALPHGLSSSQFSGTTVQQPVDSGTCSDELLGLHAILIADLTPPADSSWSKAPRMTPLGSVSENFQRVIHPSHDVMPPGGATPADPAAPTPAVPTPASPAPGLAQQTRIYESLDSQQHFL